MTLPQNLEFSCSALESNYGQKLHAVEPDETGAYEVVVGAFGCPTRNNVIYDPDSVVAAMSDPNARFNICLKDGNLAGEYGHPVIASKQDMPRLLRIDEHYISHYFTKIWIDKTTPLNIGGVQGYPIRAKVVPTGPYGEILRKQLEDPNHNTAFSIRSLCLPMNGPDCRFEYRKVQILVTFDAVSAPGYQVATKRYVKGTEDFEMSVSRADLEHTLSSMEGMESKLMINSEDIARVYHDRDYTVGGQLVARNITGRHSLVDGQGKIFDAASLLYRR